MKTCIFMIWAIVGTAYGADLREKLKTWEWLNGYSTTPYTIRTDGDVAIGVYEIPGLDSSAAAQAINNITQTQVVSYLSWYDAAQRETTRPIVFEHGIEIPADALFVIQSQTNKAGWAYFADDDGTLLKIKVHGSPWKTRSAIAADMANARENAQQTKRANAEFKRTRGAGNLQQRIERLESAVNALMDAQ